uniref:Uncharacterized protein n=1 Tax=Solanum tuberosum TaxID=4113 RepID=M1DPL5_SOLTU
MGRGIYNGFCDSSVTHISVDMPRAKGSREQGAPSQPDAGTIPPHTTTSQAIVYPLPRRYLMTSGEKCPKTNPARENKKLGNLMRRG